MFLTVHMDQFPWSHACFKLEKNSTWTCLIFLCLTGLLPSHHNMSKWDHHIHHHHTSKCDHHNYQHTMSKYVLLLVLSFFILLLMYTYSSYTTHGNHEDDNSPQQMTTTMTTIKQPPQPPQPNDGQCNEDNGWGAMMKMGPNDTSGIIWAPLVCFFSFLSCFMCSNNVFYSI